MAADSQQKTLEFENSQLDLFSSSLRPRNLKCRHLPLTQE